MQPVTVRMRNWLQAIWIVILHNQKWTTALPEHQVHVTWQKTTQASPQREVGGVLLFVLSNWSIINRSAVIKIKLTLHIMKSNLSLQHITVDFPTSAFTISLNLLHRQNYSCSCTVICGCPRMPGSAPESTDWLRTELYTTESVRQLFTTMTLLF